MVEGEVTGAGVVKTNHGLVLWWATLSLEQYFGVHDKRPNY